MFRTQEADARLAAVYDADSMYLHAHAVNESFKPNYSYLDSMSATPGGDVGVLTTDRLNYWFGKLKGWGCPFSLDFAPTGRAHTLSA